MKKEVEILKKILKSNGFSLTNQRLIVFNTLINLEPITSIELIKMLKDKLDKASIYRTIELFNKLGITNKIYMGWKYRIELTDKFQEHHHHFTCLKCNKVIMINEDSLEELIEKISNKHKIKSTDHQIEIQGYCEDCKEKIN